MSYDRGPSVCACNIEQLGVYLVAAGATVGRAHGRPTWWLIGEGCTNLARGVLVGPGRRSQGMPEVVAVPDSANTIVGS